MSFYNHVIIALQRGELIPFLGAGINLFGRDELEEFSPNTCLPSGRELAGYLARIFTYTQPDKKDLLRVSQYAATMLGPNPLYNRLGELFDADYPINDLHRFIAQLPARLKEKEEKQRNAFQLIVTTNYDDVLEQAFREANEPFDVVTYGAKPPHAGKFRHIPHGALPREGAALLRPGELKDVKGFAIKLRDGADECSRFLKGKFSPSLVRLLETLDSAAPVANQLHTNLVDELNGLLQTPLFQEPFLAGVQLAGDSLKLRETFNGNAAPQPLPSDLVRLNRLLLEEKYPQEITRSLRSYITIEDPNSYKGLPFEQLRPTRTVILKIHGTVDRAADRANLPPELIADSFVITEDDYINYLSHTDISRLVPVQLKSKLTNSGFLFLGYGLRDWNLRVIMHRLWGEQGYGYASWAIQKHAEDLDVELWSKRNVRIIEMRLEDYVAELDNKLRNGGS
jgi:hypothetical protein